MKKAFPIFLFFAFFALSLFATPSFSSEKDDISIIKQQVAEMKAQYEAQIQELEDRVKALEAQATASAAVNRAAVASHMVAQKYGPVVGYSSESLAANTSDDISKLKEVWEGEKPAITALPPEEMQAPPIKEAPEAEEPKEEPNPYADLLKSGTPFFDRVPSYLTRGFEFHGYLRSGFGTNDKGTQQIAYQAPGAEAKYRLGNETETYGELDFINKFNPERTNGPAFSVQVRVAFRTPELTNWDLINDRLLIRETFCEADNLGWNWTPDISFWAGQRFYRRLDIHINDFYIYDMSGYGGGFQDMNIPLGDSKLAVAYIGGSSDTYRFPKTGRVAKNSVDIRWYDLKVPWGKGTLWAAPSGVASGIYTDSAGNQVTYPGTGGLAVGFIHMHDIAPTGYNQITGQYGIGTGSDFNPNIQDPTPKLKDAWRFRLTESNVVQVNDHLSIMSDVIYQALDKGQTGPAKITWVSAGFRPVYYFNKSVAIALENGLDYVENQLDQYKGLLYKVTLAPMIKIDNTFFGRPEIRGYITYATWTDGFQGRVASTAYDGSLAGLSAGVQCEAWW